MNNFWKTRINELFLQDVSIGESNIKNIHMRRNHNSTFNCQLSEVHRAIDQNIIDMLRDSMVQNRILKEKIAKLEADQ